jgi:hypothetical protein
MKPNHKTKRPKPISLCPLTPEKALKLFMQVDPEKVKATEKEMRRKEKAAL